MFSLIFGGAISLFKGYMDRKNAIAVAETNNKVRLLQGEQSNNHEWEMANLTDKDKWLRRISFAMFSFPFVWIWFDPAAATEYFTVLEEVMPAFFKETYVAITGGIWGLSALKNTVPSLVQGVSQALRKSP